eukprot:6178670-Pleurochrysis_carterae.AAC.1
MLAGLTVPVPLGSALLSICLCLCARLSASSFPTRGAHPPIRTPRPRSFEVAAERSLPEHFPASSDPAHPALRTVALSRTLTPSFALLAHSLAHAPGRASNAPPCRPRASKPLMHPRSLECLSNTSMTHARRWEFKWILYCKACTMKRAKPAQTQPSERPNCPEHLIRATMPRAHPRASTLGRPRANDSYSRKCLPSHLGT